ncbi:MAG: PD-(D/E)XK nuclease family protein, partial [Clostridia bacterium]|nr:PD-(D/E)XK nuclease family protein [Clostridia bacterium]
MEIKLVTGATSYEAAINTIKQIDVTDFERQNLVVVPDSFSMQAESLIFDSLNIRSTFNIEVVGISRLAGKIMRNHNIPFQRISALEEIFTIYKVVKDSEGEFKYFKKCSLDFCIKILQVIKQFKACKIKPEQIKNTGDEMLDAKMSDLKLVFTRYEMALGEKLDLSKLLEVFVENVEKSMDLSKINLFFINFDSFSTEINSFICKLAGYVNKVYIGFSKAISQHNAYIYEDDILRKTVGFAKEYGVNISVESVPTSLTGNHLAMAENLFGFDVESFGKNDFFTNLVAKNAQDEVEFVAKYIKYQIANGAKFNKFAVAVSDKKYYDIIKTVFQQYKITNYCDDATTLSKTILGRFLLKALKIAKLGFSQDSLQYLVDSPLFEVSDRRKILEEIFYFNVKDESEFLERYPEFSSIVNRIKNLRMCKTTKQFELAISDLIQMVENNYTLLLEDLNEEKFFKEQSENAQAKELILKVIEKLGSLGENENIELEDYENLLLLSFDSVKVETIPNYIDAVFVGDATDSYFEDVDTLFVLGATAGSLPRAQSDIGIIDDEDIRKLRFNFVLEPEIKVLNRRHRLKIFELLQHAQRRLIISVPLQDENGQSERATFVSDLACLFGNNVIHTSVASDFNGSLSEEEETERLKFFVGTKENVLSSISGLIWQNKLPKNLKKNLSLWIRDGLPVDRKYVRIKNPEKAFFKNNIVSASQLENYFNCPFRHFVRYGLKVNKRENIEPNSRLFGLFEHALAEKFVSQYKDTLGGFNDKQIQEFLNQNVATIAKNIYDEKILKNKHFVDYLKNESRIILKNIVKEQKNSNFKPISCENKIFVPFYENINLVGSVDRIDACKKYFRIVDYKTGEVDSIKKDLYYGKNLQLFLYGNSVKEKFELSCGGLYYFDC